MDVTITFYNNSAEPERANKTAFLANEFTVSGVFREDISILNPVILIESETLPTYNYCYINALKRFYFIDDINIVGNKLFEIACTVDPLMTYYNIYKYLPGFIDSQENRYNDNVIDENRGFEQGYDVVEYTLENDLYDLDNPLLEADAHYLLMGLSVKTSSAVEEE